MKCRNMEDIRVPSKAFKKQNKYNKVKEVIGFDTETEKGRAFLIGFHSDKNKFILNSIDIIEQLNFLSDRRFSQSFNFFYNITYDTNAIIKSLPYDNLVELSKWDKTLYKDYRIQIIPNKALTITNLKDKNRKVTYYDLAQFYHKIKLDTAAKKYLKLEFGKDNLESEGIDIKNLSNKTYQSDNDYKYILNKYLYRDCEITKLLSDKLYQMMIPYLNPKYFYSQASISQQYFLENLKQNMSLPPRKIYQFALDSYQGGRFETFIKGSFDKMHIADIKSAYPYHNIKIPDLVNGIWKNNKDYCTDSLISLYKIKTNIYDTKISPLKYQVKNGTLTYPIGKFEGVYTNQAELDILEKMGYKYEILQAYHYYDKEPTYPYKFLEKFYDLKEHHKKEGNKELSMIPKYIINGFYGKTIQINDYFEFTKKENKPDERFLDDIIEFKEELIYIYKKFKAGLLFNPIVANEITANTRCQLFNAVWKKQENVVGFQTDSILSKEKLKGIKYEEKLGSWEMENRKPFPMIILGSGIYQSLDDSFNKKRIRGFKKNLDLFDLLNKNIDNEGIKVTLTRNHKLKRTIKSKATEKEKIDKFNLILDEVKTINLNFDKKRIWERKFIDCRDVLENQINSIPLRL